MINRQVEDYERISSIQTALQHRGPDSDGRFVNGKVILAMTRLSIVDEKGSEQPLFNENKKIVFIYNGMIYNFRELREHLKKRGHIFRTNGDGEVIIHLYEEYNIDGLSKLHGMFSCALYDAAIGKVFLGRDSLGIKPLYYTYAESLGSLYFCSESRPLLRLNTVAHRIDVDSVDMYLTYNYVPGEKTIYQNIYEVLPGCYVEVSQDGTYKKGCYQNISSVVPQRRDENEIIKNIDVLLDNSVKKHMIADKEVGCFLSGGIDSSALTYYLTKNSNRPIKTFSVGYQNKAYDERTYARIISRQFNTDHYEIVCTVEDVIDYLDKLPLYGNGPVGDQASVSTYLICKLASRYVKVCLSGEGADELFLGYPTYRADILFRYFCCFPSKIMQKLERLFSYMHASEKKVGFDYKAIKFLQGLQLKDVYTAHAFWRSIFTEEEKTLMLLANKSKKDIYELYYAQCPKQDKTLKHFTYGDLMTWLSSNGLMRTDTLSMVNSLEVRLPFLHNPVVKYMMSLPFKSKFRFFMYKHLLRKVLIGKIDNTVLWRKKEGWHMPIAYWLKRDMYTYCMDTFKSSHPLLDTVLNRNACIDLCINHQKGNGNHSFKIWGLLVLLKSYYI